ncbi:hypothetical protein O5D80_008469 [Batrachochytrium dendrobatidis]|nr:hypothetical protein O5D80_008469 [Batrachochytrium dendrobatidis]
MSRPCYQILRLFFLGFIVPSSAVFVPSYSTTIAPISSQICSLSASSIFDPTQLQCVSCPQQTVSGISTSCSCSTGVRQIGVSCVTCTLPLIPSNDGTFCVSCPSTAPATQITLLNSTFSVCNCPAGQYFSDRNTNGSSLATGVCTACPSGYYPSRDLSFCIACPDTLNMVATLNSGSYTCSCLTAGGYTSPPQGSICMLASTVSNVISTFGAVDASVSFKDMIDINGNPTQNTIQSDTIAKNYIQAIGKCQVDGSLQYCQVLANLCVLAIYDQSNKLCAAYLTMAKSRQSILSSPYDDQPIGLPWLYYGIVNHESPQTTQQKIPNVVLDSTGLSGSLRLPFVLGVYHLNGSFLGYQNLTTQFQLCSTDSLTASNWDRVARDYTNTCLLNLYNLVSQNYDTYFYELFLAQPLGQLYPVPIRISNYRTVSGLQINRNPSMIDWSNSQLFRRFFLIDTASGIVNGATTIVRFPSSISITIFKASDVGKITLPIVDITYTEREISAISETDKSIFSTTPISFSVAYVQDYSVIKQVLMYTFVIAIAVGLVYAFYTTRLWSSRNLGPYDSIDIRFIFRLLVNVCGALGPIMGSYLFVVVVCFFIFFKIQSVLFIYIPYNPSDMSLVTMAVAGITVAEFVYIAKLMIVQCTTHVFFIDWERSKGYVVGSGNDETTAMISPVSIWRSIFMANQWNALQIHQRVHVGFTLVALLALLEGLGWRYLATSYAGFSDLSIDTPNPLLLVAVDSLLWMLLIIVQVVFQAIYSRFHRNKLLQYIDILSLSNISLFVFDSQCHGYYVHGRSVHSFADTNMDELNNFLRKEENDMVPRRGLHDTNQQAFEIFVTRTMRTAFDKIFDQSIVLQQEAQRLNNMVNRLTINDIKGGSFKDPIKPAAEPQIKEYHQVNRFLRSFIDQNLKEIPYIIRKKTYFEQFFAAPDPSEGNVFFPNDSGYSRILLYGMEMHLMFAYTYLFAFVDTLTNSPAKAAIVVWVVHFIICSIRRHFGEINMSKKTLLDWKFLV